MRSVPSRPALIASSGTCAVIDTIASMPGVLCFTCTLMCRYVSGARFPSRVASLVLKRKRARLGKEVVDEPVDRRYAHEPARFLGACADVRGRDEVLQVQELVVGRRLDRERVDRRRRDAARLQAFLERG